MSSARNNSDLIESFVRDLEDVNGQLQKLLDEVRASEIDFASTKTELRILNENVKDLSHLIRNGDGSLLTRIALAEQEIHFLKEKTKKIGDDISGKTATNDAGKWQLRVALWTGIFAILASGINFLLSRVG